MADVFDHFLPLSCCISDITWSADFRRRLALSVGPNVATTYYVINIESSFYNFKLVVNQPFYLLVNAKAHIHGVLITKVSIDSKNI